MKRLMMKLGTTSAALMSVAVLTSASAFGQATAQPSQPLRTAHVRGVISKATIVYSPFSINEAEVCRFDLDIPLYDVMKQGEYQSLTKLPECHSTVDNKSVKLSPFVSMGLTATALGAPAAAKSVQALLQVNEVNGTTVNDRQTAGASSDDLKVKTLSLFVTSPVYKMATTTGAEETFVVRATFEDLNQ